jgi:formyltetrahydrofolate deformylase
MSEPTRPNITSPNITSPNITRPNTARLLISCPDRRGIVAAVSQFLFSHGANIIASDQHSTDPEGGRFFMRQEFFLEGLDLTKSQFERAFAEVVAEPFGMEWKLWYSSEPKRMAILASKYDHCLLDLLWRVRRGEFDCVVPLVISNHADLEADVRSFGIPFHHVPVVGGDKAAGKAASEAKMLELLQSVDDGFPGTDRRNADFIVLARYMQIISQDFLERVSMPVINIHHSFLPAFVGANPYKAALARGVKIIGATAHYVTAELDAGPIIEQDVERVSHRDDLAALTRVGRDIERSVLAKAVKAHLEDRVLVWQNKTVAF